MTRFALLLSAVFLAGGLAGWLVSTTRGPAVSAQPPADPPPAAPKAARKESPEAGIKAITAEYARAFNARDAKAAAALFTANAEYTGADGETITGRDAIEKSLAAAFKESPKTKTEIRVESVRAVARGLATAEGVITVKLPGEEAPTESRYTALHVLEDGKWLAASVREWVPDPATDVTPQQLAWLVGEWDAKGADGSEVKIGYRWEDKVFLVGKYTVLKDGKTVSKGTQVIGRNPAGGLRSWMYDSSGTTSDGEWVRDGNRWINEARGMLPDGTEVTSVNVLIPLGPDAFTWQTTEREVNGEPATALAPIKVTRVKK